ncbi:MAG: response regulator [Saprospiraceae bacterium]|nr:response regulator [Saprospiraceae bacterium]
MCCILFLFPGFVHGLFAQPANYRFEQIKAELGLDQGTITAILQDRKGFMWFGTWLGLAQYDGYEVRFFKQSAGTGLGSNKVTALLEDRKGRLWVGTSNAGLYLFDREKERFIAYQRESDNANSLSNNNVWALCEDDEGFLWIGTDKGLNRLNPESGRFSHFYRQPGDDASLSNDFIYSLCTGPDGSIWVGTIDGLNRIVRQPNRQGWQVMRYEIAPSSTENTEFHRFIYRIRNALHEPNALWIGTKGGLKKATYAPAQAGRWQSIVHFEHVPGDPSSLSNNYVTDIWERKGDSSLWLATFHGLNRLAFGGHKFRRFHSGDDERYSITNNTVRSLFEDRGGIFWIGTEKGVNRINFKSKPFYHLSPDPVKNSNRNITASLVRGRAEEGLWLGTRGGGLMFLPMENGQFQQQKIRQIPLQTHTASMAAAMVSYLILDRKGNIWMTTHGAGVLRFSETRPPPAGPVTHFSKGRNQNLPDDYVMTFFESEKDGVWLGMWDAGLCRYDESRGQFRQFTRSDDASAFNFRAFPNVNMLETKEGQRSILWVATRGGGLLKLSFNPQKETLDVLANFTHKESDPGSICHDVVNYLFLDSRNNLWVGTEGGLDMLAPGAQAFQHHSEKNNAVNDIVRGILEDRQGNIWYSSQTGGISCLNQSGETVTFTSNGDLQGNYFYEPANCVLPAAGMMVFGGVNGLTYFNPSRIQKNKTVPAVAITGFRLFNTPVKPGQYSDSGRLILDKSIIESPQITLEHTQNVLAFEFAALQYDYPEKNRFAYKLAGFNKDWTYVDAGQRLAQYTNLPHGDYTFIVKATNSDGVWNETPATVKLCILAPWWQTWWAYAAYILFGLGVIYGIRRVELTRFDLRKKLAIERVEREKLEELSQMKSQFFTNISHELRTPLTLIISPLEQLIREARTNRTFYQTFSLMHHNASRLLTMINQLLDIRKGEEGMTKLHVSEDDFVQFVEEIVLSFKSWANQREIDLVFLPETPSFKVWFDREQMEKVAYNLLSNAFKFTPDKGRVRVEVLTTGAGALQQFACLRVSDTGPGIPEDQQTRIFERFYQVAHQKPVRGGQEGIGTGIGLALVKLLVERHHGQVEVVSKMGEGSTFSIFLPLGNAHFSPEDIQKSPAISESLISHFLPVRQDIPHEAAPTATEPSAETITRKYPLLIVEDNEDIRAFLRQSLESEYEIAEAADGKTGLALALENPPDLVISDIAMPEMDGIELCRNLKTNVLTSHIPVILLTARTSLIFKIDGLETGADDYITKPFNLHLLRLRMRNLIHIREKLREKYNRQLEFKIPETEADTSLDDTFLATLIRSIENNLEDSEFSVDQLAAGVFLSRMQLYRKLKALTDQTPHDLIRTCRLRKAAALLATGKYTVAEITYKVGYTDLKHFREQFRKQFGVSPSAYE